MNSVYVVYVFICDDYEFAEDRFSESVLDSVWKTRESAKKYVDSFSMYDWGFKTYLFGRDVETKAYRSAEIKNWHGYGDNAYVTFEIVELELRE